MLRLFLALALTFSAWAGAAAQDLAAIPPLARVTDTTGTLSPAQKQALDAKLAAFEHAHGAQVAVLMVPSTQPEPIEDYAHRVGEAWKIGRAGVGDGLLMIVAKNDKRVRIDVARALEGAIPDLAAKRVIREDMAPRFQQGDFAGGINAGIDRLFGLIEGEALPPPQAKPAARSAPGFNLELLGLAIFAGAALAGLLRRAIGVPGALVGGAAAGALGGWLAGSILLGAVIAIGALVFGLVGGSRAWQAARTVGGRRGPVFIPGGWSGGGGGGWSSGGGGWSSGGGGDFSGGGASGDW